MSLRTLKTLILPSNGQHTYIRILCNNNLIGNVFGKRWVHNDRQVLWITQLCVSLEHRNQGIAKWLLEEMREEGDVGFGILSSQPFAVMAFLRAFGRGLRELEMETSKEKVQAVMESCPIGYVRDATLLEGEDGIVRCADTKFWVDHAEPNAAIEVIEKEGVWPLGELPDGHEYLAWLKK